VDTAPGVGMCADGVLMNETASTLETVRFVSDATLAITLGIMLVAF